MTDSKPLVLDVDGTLLCTDRLFENFWAGLGQKSLATLKATFKHMRHPARLNQELVNVADRMHPKKCYHSFAAGKVPIVIGMLTSIGLGVIGALLVFYAAGLWQTWFGF